MRRLPSLRVPAFGPAHIVMAVAALLLVLFAYSALQTAAQSYQLRESKRGRGVLRPWAAAGAGSGGGPPAVDAVAERLGRRVLYGSVSDSGAPARRAGSEAAAREARYRWLADACAEAGAVRCVTGHTLDDQAETVLLRLTRGAGSPGVAAMAPEAPWPVPCEGGRLRLLRPLLGVRREEARAYLESLELQPRLDPTNDLLTFDRNRLRHRVLPQLRAVNPRAEEALARFALLARRDDEALEAWAEREAGKLVRMEVKTVAIRRRELLALPEAVSSRLLRRAAGEVGIALEGAQVEQLLHIARRRGARLSLTGGAAEVVGEELLIRPTREN